MTGITGITAPAAPSTEAADASHPIPRGASGLGRTLPGDAATPSHPVPRHDPPRYPLLLDLAGRDVLVVGGGPVAARRAAGLHEAGALVHVIAPQLCEDLLDATEAGELTWSPREATRGDVAAGPGASDRRTGPASDEGDPVRRWWLVHTATGDPEVDAAVADEAHRSGIWCVRADSAADSAAHTPAVATGPDGVQVAVSGGGDPGRARVIRDAISDLLAAGRLPLRRTRRPLVEAPGHPPARPAVPATSTAPAASPGASLPPSDRSAIARTDADSIRFSDGGSSEKRIDPGGDPREGGRVILVGGGPGDPGLLTVAGRQWLARADVVVADRLGPRSVLAELDPSVEVIDVGKTAGNHPMPQDQINATLVEQAQLGRTVVRLKGGDPFVLGRGGEEALHCIEHGVPVEVVPGVTSAVSVPAAAGIPVTHRGVTSSVVVATGHVGAANALAAARGAPPDATLVLLMGLAGLGGTAAELISAGRPADTPIAVVSDGWSPRQRTVVGTLETIADDVEQAELPGPAVIVVGEVVRLRTQLRQLDRRVAAGRRPDATTMTR